MNPSDPLTQLKDIHSPDAISWWPLALGWWLVIFVCLAVLAGLILWWVKRRGQRRYLSQAQRELHTLIHAKLSASEFIEAVNRILKRVALHRNPNSRAGTLSGQAWLEYLDQSVSPSSVVFREGAGLPLGEAAYRPNPEVDQEAVITLAKHWVKQHKSANKTKIKESAHV
ncbi:DUF4381 domain-containing protein [Gilvimarinus polysaccharolyticus]|uniref:DUF4381 domain-containing protein n=1 Tax=Gilvimarinus polysaccharolyticus TaxID=863921 RepID=UPI0006731BD5|nr:DUF4381 domain-containing protein [Gilvimarinus polysaccharolyticus]